MPHEHRPDNEATAASSLPVLEIGWVLAARLDDVDRRAVEQARDTTLTFFREHLPEFVWRMPLLRREELSSNSREHAVVLLDAGIIERNIHHWDFSLLVTGADLVSHYKTDAIAAISRALEGAVISTSRIDPKAQSPELSDTTRTDQLARRVHVLAVHTVCQFCGLGHEDDPENFLFDFAITDDLDRAHHLTAAQIEELRRDLRQVADQRLEERASHRLTSSSAFYLRAAWINRGDIFESLIEAKPWQFPFRLSRLTAAAVSSVLVLMMTAEAWDLGMSQRPDFVVILSLVAILFTTSYTVVRQRLLVRREHRELSEQNVVTNLSTLAIVTAGITTTYCFLFLLTLTAAQTLYSSAIAENWAASIRGELTYAHYLTLAAFVASLGIFIGSLGASFEEQHYFRHVTFVDEEV